MSALGTFEQSSTVAWQAGAKMQVFPKNKAHEIIKKTQLW